MQLSDMEGPCLLANTNLLTDILNSGVRRVGGSVTAVSVHGGGVSNSCVGSNDTHSMRVRNSAQRWKGDSWKYTRQGSNAEKE